MAEREPLEERRDRLQDSPRREEVARLLQPIEALSPDVPEGRFNAIAMLMVDATLEGDEAIIDKTVRDLQRIVARYHGATKPELIERRGRLLGLLDVARWGLERSLPLESMIELENESHAHNMLRVLAEEPGRSNRALATELSVDESEVSRVGRKLAQLGFARKRRVGRTNEWSVTPRGIYALDVMEHGGIARYQRPHHQLLGT
jgi:hypothetical protein